MVWWSRPVPSRRRRGGGGRGRRAGRGGRVSWRGNGSGRGVVRPSRSAGTSAVPLRAGLRRERLPRRRGGGPALPAPASAPGCGGWPGPPPPATRRWGGRPPCATAASGRRSGGSRGCPTARRGARSGSAPTRPRRWPSAARPRRPGWRWGRRGPPGPGSPCWRRRPTGRGRGRRPGRSGLRSLTGCWKVRGRTSPPGPAGRGRARSGSERSWAAARSARRISSPQPSRNHPGGCSRSRRTRWETRRTRKLLRGMREMKPLPRAHSAPRGARARTTRPDISATKNSNTVAAGDSGATCPSQASSRAVTGARGRRPRRAAARTRSRISRQGSERRSSCRARLAGTSQSVRAARASEMRATR